MKKDEVEKSLDGVKKSIWKIDKQMLPYKVHYFLLFGAMGALLPYLPSIGITRLRLGAINLAVVFTVQHFFMMVFKPIIGYSVDYFNNLKRMIVALTIINGGLWYLLLVIPKVNELGDISQMITQPTHNVFCELCPVSIELETMVEYLSVAPKEYRNEIFCSKENPAFENFAVYCPKKSNLSIAFNIKFELKIKTCYAAEHKSKQLRNRDAKSLENKISKKSIKIYHIRMPSELGIVCPDMNNSFEFQTLNSTLKNILTFCFKYPEEQNTSWYTVADIFPWPSNNIVCNNSEVSEKYAVVNSKSFKTYQFWLYSLILVLSCICTSSIFSLSDTACHEAVHKTGADYGKQRAWGAIGWGLFAPFAGFLNDYTDNYWAAMILMSVLCALQIWNLEKINLVKPQCSQSIFKDIIFIISSVEFIVFEAGVFLNGMGIGIVWSLLTWFITDIGGSRLLVGLAHTVQCFLGEMPFMFFSGLLIRKIGHFNVTNLALLANTIRFMAYSSLKNPWMILPIECLDGITFGAFYAAMTSYGKLKAKPGTEATTQSLLCATFKGLGAGIGSVIGGACFDYLGGYTALFYAGLFFAGATTLNVTSTILLHFKKRSVVISTKTTDDLRY